MPFINEVINSDRILVKKAQEIKEKRNKISIGYTAPGIFYKYSDIFMNKGSATIKIDILPANSILFASTLSPASKQQSDAN